MPTSNFEPQIPPLPVRIKKLITYKNKLRRLWQRSPDPTLKSSINAFRRLIQQEIQSHIKSHWEKRLSHIEKHNKNSLWKIARNFNTNSVTHIPPLKSADSIASSDHQKADTLCRHYKNIHIAEKEQSYPSVKRATNTYIKTLFSLCRSIPTLTTPSEIMDIIKNLKINLLLALASYATLY